MHKRILYSAVLTMALAAVIGSTPALADTGTLYVGGTYSTLIGGGSIDRSTWKGTPLEFLFCIDTAHNVGVPNYYYNTVATDDGRVSAPLAFVGGQGTNAIAGQIAWLLDKHGVDQQNTDAVIQLQEAIWKAVYHDVNYLYDAGNVSGANRTGAASLYTASLGKTGNIGSYLWFTPSGTGNIQYLVGKVPEPTSVVFLGAFLVAGLLGLGAKRKLVQAGESLASQGPKRSTV